MVTDRSGILDGSPRKDAMPRGHEPQVPVGIPLMRGEVREQFDPYAVSSMSLRGGLTPAMREWARWDMKPGTTDIRLLTKQQVVHMPYYQAAASPGGVLPFQDPIYAVNTLDGAMMEMHQSVASDGPLAHICNFFTELVMGTGFRPEMVPVPQKGDDPDEPREPGPEEDEAVAFLRAADCHPGTSGNAMWPSLFEAVTQLVKLTTVYHRACIVKHGTIDGGETMSWDGEECAMVPQGLEVVHPMDLGMVGLNEQRVPVSIYRTGFSMERLALPRLIYASGSLEGCHVHNAPGFGLSPMSGCIDAARLFDKIEKEDLPAALRTAWTRIPLIFVNLPGGEGPRKMQLLRNLAAQLNAGGPTLVGIDPNNVEVEDLDMDPSLDKMLEIRTGLLNYMAAHMNLPQVSVGEKDTTRAASAAKSNLMVQGSIQPRRDRLGELLSRSWYMPILKEKYPDVAKKWRVSVVFDNLDTESLAQKVEAINGIMASFALKGWAYGRLLNIKGFDRMIDQELQKKRQEAELAPTDSSGAPAKGGKNPGKGAGNKRNVSKPDEVNEK